MNKKFIKTNLVTLLTFFVIIFSLTLPYVAHAQLSGLTYVCRSGPPGECTFDDLIRAVNSLVNWGTLFALQFSVVVLAYAGFRFMISGDNAGERTKAREMLFSVIKGIVLIICAWVIVNLITTSLGVNVSFMR